jgi:hypothetical protein
MYRHVNEDIPTKMWLPPVLLTWVVLFLTLLSTNGYL